MNTRQKDFLISNIIAVGFSILITLVVHFFISSIFPFDQSTFYPITFVLILFGVGVYYFITKNLFIVLFQNEKEIDALIKETLHEINTPVATIQMNTKMLQKNCSNDPKNFQRLQRIELSCQNLLELYEQMEYELKEQIESVNLEEFDLLEVLQKSIEKFDTLAKDKNIKIQNNVSNVMVVCDKNGIQRVIDNLLSNSVKYNKPEGLIIFEFENNFFSITDTGIGIDTKHLFGVFDKYYQEDVNVQGIGLGLNIVKRYCDKHKIEIKIDSQKDRGTTISLDLKGILWQ